jgi:hypothetical protein
MNKRYSLEIDNGTCIHFSDYPFNETGLKKAKDIVESLIRSSSKKLQSIKIYNPENQIIFENEF